MKLRNKKTGGLVNCETITVFTDDGWHDYDTLTELNAEWEDHTPLEPLIKDEKIRKAVKAWAEANNANEIIIAYALEYDEYLLYTDYGAKIKFTSNLDIKGGSYSIAELCGEEE